MIRFMATRVVKKKAPSSHRRPTLTRSIAVKGKVTKEFARQVAEFIERYRPALEALAQK